MGRSNQSTPDMFGITLARSEEIFIFIRDASLSCYSSKTTIGELYNRINKEYTKSSDREYAFFCMGIALGTIFSHDQNKIHDDSCCNDQPTGGEAS